MGVVYLPVIKFDTLLKHFPNLHILVVPLAAARHDSQVVIRFCP